MRTDSRWGDDKGGRIGVTRGTRHGRVAAKEVREGMRGALNKLILESISTKGLENAGLAGVETLGFLEVAKGSVVSANNELVAGPLEEVAPVG